MQFIKLILDCGSNKVISDGNIDFSAAETTYGSTVNVTCDAGYSLIGGTMIECLADGTWSNTVTCQIKGNITTCIRNFLYKNGSNMQCRSCL